MVKRSRSLSSPWVHCPLCTALIRTEDVGSHFTDRCRFLRANPTSTTMTACPCCRTVMHAKDLRAHMSSCIPLPSDPNLPQVPRRDDVQTRRSTSAFRERCAYCDEPILKQNMAVHLDARCPVLYPHIMHAGPVVTPVKQPVWYKNFWVTEAIFGTGVANYRRRSRKRR